MVEAVHKEALKILKKKGDIIETSSLYEAIHLALFAQFGNLSNIVLDSIMDIFLDIVKGEEKFIGLEKWKILNPATLKTGIIYASGNFF